MHPARISDRSLSEKSEKKKKVRNIFHEEPFCKESLTVSCSLFLLNLSVNLIYLELAFILCQTSICCHWLILYQGLPGSSDGKESACNVRDPGLVRGQGRSPGKGNGQPLQYSCLENPMDKRSWGLQSTGLQRMGQD